MPAALRQLKRRARLPAAALTALVALAVGCAGGEGTSTVIEDYPGPGPQFGGQSGTDQNSTSCPGSPDAAPFERKTSLGFGAADVIAQLEQSVGAWPPVLLTWQFDAPPTDVEFEPLDHANTVTVLESDVAPCTRVDVEIRARVRTADGSL